MIKIGTDILVFNPHLREARISAGFKTNSALCRAIGMSVCTYGGYERLRSYPRRPDVIEKLERALKRDYDYLFPKELREAIDAGAGRWKRLERVHEVPMSALASPEVLAIEYDHMADDQAIDNERDQVLNMMLHTLKGRDREVLEHRFGLNGHTEKTLKATGDIMGVTPERLRQMEAKALWLLRHPQRSAGLREYL